MENKEEKKTQQGGEEEELKKQAEEFAGVLKEKLGLDTLAEKLDKVLEKKAAKDKRLAKILVGNRSLDELDKNEKVLVWFGAVLRNDEKILKTLQEGAAAEGGYLFPDEFRAEIIRDIAEAPRLRGLVRTVPMKRDIMKIPKVTSKPVVSWISEQGTKSTTSIGFGEATLTAYKLAAIIYATDELIEDSDLIDVVSLIKTLFAEAIGDKEDQAIAAGSGSGEPTGLTNCSLSSVACSGNLDFDDIINLIYALPSKYRRNASFLVHNTNIKELRKIKDSQNRYVWQEPVAPKQPATIYGYPVHEVNHLPESEIYFGDWKQVYWLGDRKKMTIETTRTTETAWTKDLTSIRVVERIAGNCVLTEAGRVLNNIP